MICDMVNISTVTGEIRDTSAVTRRLHRIQEQACREYAFTTCDTALQPYPLNKEWTLKPYRIC